MATGDPGDGNTRSCVAPAAERVCVPARPVIRGSRGHCDQARSGEARCPFRVRKGNSVVKRILDD